MSIENQVSLPSKANEMTKSACHRLAAASFQYTIIKIRGFIYVPRTQHSPLFVLFDCHNEEEEEEEEEEEGGGSGKRW